MSTRLVEAAGRGPHLALASAVPTRGDGKFVLHGDYAYLGQRYGSADHLTIVDVTDPTNVRLATEMPFKRAITSIAVSGSTLLATETYRALNLLDLSNPAEPEYFECALALGRSLNDVAVLGNCAVLAMNWDGVGLVDISDPAEATISSSIKLPEGYVDHVLVVGEHIYAPGGSGGLHVFEIRDAELHEVAHHTGEKVRVGNVFHLDGKVWALADLDGKSHIWVIDPATPAVVEKSFRYKCVEPRAMLALGDGTALGFSSNYTCMGFDPQTGWAGDIFKQYTADGDGSYREIPCDTEGLSEEQQQALWSEPLTCMDGIRHAVVRDGYLYVTQGQEFQVFRILEGSILA